MLVFIQLVTICFSSILWIGVSAQCTDPIIYKLSDIHQLIANITVKQQRQEENLTYCNTEIQKQAKQLENHEDRLSEQVFERYIIKGIFRGPEAL